MSDIADAAALSPLAISSGGLGCAQLLQLLARLHRQAAATGGLDGPSCAVMARLIQRAATEIAGLEQTLLDALVDLSNTLPAASCQQAMPGSDGGP